VQDREDLEAREETKSERSEGEEQEIPLAHLVPPEFPPVIVAEAEELTALMVQGPREGTLIQDREYIHSMCEHLRDRAPDCYKCEFSVQRTPVDTAKVYHGT
jgi:hypothetical protein